MVDYVKTLEGEYRPTLYPGEEVDVDSMPDEIKTDFSRLNSAIENKYSREFLKVCAFYNKLFPSLRYSDWSTSSYNVPPYTSKDQERSDTGSGQSCNYLKQIIDQIVSRLGTIKFEPFLKADSPNLSFIIYKDECERLLRMQMKETKFNHMCLRAFHDAAILGYAHILIDPFTNDFLYASDFEIGMFESQFEQDEVLQLLYRNYCFPVSNVPKYIQHCSDDLKKEILEMISGKTCVDMKMYFDCIKKNVYVQIDNKEVTPYEYNFDKVLMCTFSWDLGVRKTFTTSLFDLLYPIQREINKINAKIQQLIRLYKGPVPVFNNDVELAMKSITNGTGECLYVDSSRPIDNLMTVINPTPLDSQLGAEIESRKAQMYELAGLQQMSFDMENMRSASAVVALDQLRDSVFQSQMQQFSEFIEECLNMFITYKACIMFDDPRVDWKVFKQLLETAQLSLKPVHLNDPLSDNSTIDNGEPTDYEQLQTARITLDVLSGKMTYDRIPYYLDPDKITIIVATVLVKLDSLGVLIPDTVHHFLMDAYIDQVKQGKINL